MDSYLYDIEFLEKLHKNKNRNIFGKIVLLNYSEQPLQEIQGLVTQGNVNIDGSAALRRTCSLTLDYNPNETDPLSIGLQSKFKLYIGLKNEIDDRYPAICWFKQGLFVVQDYKITNSEQKDSLSITGQDKMCLLNGNVGGSFYAQEKLDTMEIEDIDGNILLKKIPIKEIIYNMMVEKGHELAHNVIIRDFDDFAYELWEYRGSKPLYIVYKSHNMGTNEEPDYRLTPFCYTQDASEVDAFFDDQNWQYINLKDYNVNDESIQKAVYVLEAGQAAGYHQTELIYPSDLVANVGENIVTVFDKIKNLLGQFEYFYDVDGKFIFQKKAQYIETIDTLQKYSFNIVNNATFESILNSDYLLKSISPTTKASDIKNDFAVWGTRKGVSGAEIPIHARVAIDKKPEKYKRIKITEQDIKKLKELYPTQYPLDASVYIDNYTENQKEFTIFDNFTNQTNENIGLLDWREIIYQMAYDYFKYHRLDDFYYKVEEANPQYINGITGYEHYYTDMFAFWRDLYKTDNYEEYKGKKTKDNIIGKYMYINTNYLEEITEDNIEKIFNMYLTDKEGNVRTEEEILQIIVVYNRYQSGWQDNVLYNSPNLNFWFDFIEPVGDLEQYSIKNIGDRTKFKNDKGANVILTEQISNIRFQPIDEPYWGKGSMDLDILQIPQNIRDLFVIASKNTSVLSKINELVNTHTQAMTGVSVTMLPVYYLEPNKLFYLNNTKNKIEGKFFINKITLPLTYNGTMNITATKIIEQMEVNENV